MDTHTHDIIQELDAYCAANKCEPSTVTRKATGNPRLRDRLISRLERTREDVEKLRKFMRDNPSAGPEGSLACNADQDARSMGALPQTDGRKSRAAS